MEALDYHLHRVLPLEKNEGETSLKLRRIGEIYLMIVTQRLLDLRV